MDFSPFSMSCCFDPGSPWQQVDDEVYSSGHCLTRLQKIRQIMSLDFNLQFFKVGGAFSQL